jgi:cell division protein FtsB
MKRPAKSSPAAVSAALRGFRFNARTVTLLLIIVIGVVTLAPRVQTWFIQRQQIAEAQAQLQAAKDDVKKMEVERRRWEDPAYIRAQARDRLYYVMPGEVSYLVMDADGVDLSDTSGTVGARMAADKNTNEISTSIRQTKNNWVDAVLESVVRAGTEEPTAESKK